VTEAELLASLRPLRLHVDYVAPGLADLSVAFCLGLLAGGVMFAAVFPFLRHMVAPVPARRRCWRVTPAFRRCVRHHGTQRCIVAGRCPTPTRLTVPFLQRSECAGAMPEFVLPLVLLALPLGLLARLLTVRQRVPAAALREPRATAMLLTDRIGVRRRTRWDTALAAALWCLLVIAIANPRVPGQTLALPVSGRDIILTLDLSGSMQGHRFRA
jgi:hypothetical protein